jgi:hypothetical protein
MLKSDRLLREKLASMPVLTDAERDNALRLVAQGESIAEALLSLARLFHRVPSLHHAAH